MSTGFCESVPLYYGFTFNYHGDRKFTPIFVEGGTPLKPYEIKISPHGSGAYFHAISRRVKCTGFDDVVNPFLGVREMSTISGEWVGGCVVYADGAQAYSACCTDNDSRQEHYAYVDVTLYRYVNTSWYPMWSTSIHTAWGTLHRGRLPGSQCIDFCKQAAATLLTLPNSSLRSRNSLNGPHWGTVEYEPPEFRFNELNDFTLYDEFGLLTNRWRALAGNAYISAAQNLPKTANNSIQNLFQVIDGIKDLRSGNLGKSARDFIRSNALDKAKQAWLTYRYSYKTTQLDLQEYRALSERIKSLRHAKRIETFGQYASEVAYCRCCFKVNASDWIPHNFSEFLKSYGFYLKAADVWDDIPFSFMVDWFLHLGDLLEFFDETGQAVEVRPTEIWYSFVTTYDDQTCYWRIPGVAITNAPYLDFNKGSSSKVKAMRIADTISIFT